MSLGAFLQESHRLLEEAGIAHALIGGFAMAALGHARATNDVDFLVNGDYRQQILSIFQDAGFEVFYSSDEVLQLSREHPLDLLFAHRPLAREMLERAATLPTYRGIPVLDAADIVGLKIQAYKNDPKRELAELADILKLVELCPNLNHERIIRYAELFKEEKRVKSLLGNKTL